MKQYYMAFLKRGPDRSHDSATAVSIQAGHMAHINKMAADKKLIIAGPFIGNNEFRGIFVFSVNDEAEAKALVEADPAVQSGRLTMELIPWYSAKYLEDNAHTIAEAINNNQLNIQSLSPNLMVRNMDNSIKFYENLGFKVVNQVPEKAPFEWAMLQYGSFSLMLQEEKSLRKEVKSLAKTPIGASATFFMNVADVKPLYEKLKGNILKELTETSYGILEFTAKDPDGYLFTFAQKVSK